MKILNHGPKQKIEFITICKNCKCEFLVDQEEDIEINRGEVPWEEDIYKITCPDCGCKMIIKDKRILKNLESFFNKSSTHTITSKYPDRTDNIYNTECSCYN